MEKQHRLSLLRDETLAMPLSSAQQGMWFAQQLNLDANPKVFKITEYLQIDGEVEVSVLLNAFQHTLKETESFQRIFYTGKMGPLQQTVVHQPYVIPVIDCSEAADPQQMARDWVENESQSAWDWDYDRLFSLAVLKLSPTCFWYFACAHHLIIDGFGAQLLSSRVAQVYSAMMADEPIPECDFTPLNKVLESEERYRTSNAYQKDRQYWLDQMAGMPTPLSLCERRAVCTGIVRRQSYLPEETHQALRRLAADLGTPLPQLLIALTALFLYRITGEQDLLVGCPMTGRSSKVARRYAGMMSNVLPLRLAIDPNGTLADLVEQVQGRVLSMVRHQNYRGEELSQELGLTKVDDALVLTHINILPFEYDMTFAGLPVQANNVSLGPLDDLSINVCDRGAEQGLELCIDANRTLYDDATLDGHFQRLMHFYTAVTKVSQQSSLADYPIMMREDLAQWQRWNDTVQDFGPHQPVFRLFEQQVEQTPHAIALSVEEGQLTYDALNRRANQLAHYLRERGVGPEVKVAVCCDRSWDWLIAMVAVWKAGGAYVPIDPAYPMERIDYIMQDCAPQFLLSDGVVSFEEQQSPVEVLHMSEDEVLWMFGSEENPSHEQYEANHLAYIIYTSGSTGKPKGVMVEHCTLTNLVHWHNQAFAVTSASVVSSVAGMGFDATVWEVWPALCVGGELCAPKLEVTRDPQQLLNWWVNQPVQLSFLPTPIAELAFAQNVAPATLKTLLVGGDKLTRNAPPEAHYELVNNYGPTETTVVTTSGSMTNADILHIGAPIANSRIYVLDEQHKRVPCGVTGEIYIGGAGVARGYVNLPEQTASRFLPDPFADLPYARMYRTGDLARWCPDGTLEYRGRNDSQVKIRGFRIELGEIAHSVQACQGVELAVVTVEKEAQDQRIIAYFTVNQALESTPTPNALHQELAQTLPSYMMPSAYVELAQMPLTANGKVDYRALPKPTEGAFIQREYEAPQGEVELRMAQIWQHLLGVNRVGRQDNFFELGGHSLLAVQLIDQLRQHGDELSIKALFTHPTLAQLATQVNNSVLEPTVIESLDTDQPDVLEPSQHNELTPLQKDILQHRLRAEQESEPLLALHERYRHPDYLTQLVLPIRENGTQTPLFYFGDDDENQAWLEQLSIALDPRVPVYRLRCGEQVLPQLNTLQKLAEYYVLAIRQCQPQGPYQLIGRGAAGMIAYEVATQLMGVDQEVRYLGLIDCWAATTQAQQLRLSEHSPVSVVPLLNAHTGQAWIEHEYQIHRLPLSLNLFVSQATDSTLGWEHYYAVTELALTIGSANAAYITPNQVAEQLNRDLLDGTVVTGLPHYDPLIPLQTGYRDGDIAICIPGGGDNVFAFIDLVEQMDNAMSVYGLQPRGLWGDLPAHTQVQAAAHCYLNAILPLLVKDQGTGEKTLGRKVHIIGHSFGGWVALELTQLLEAKGVEVVELVMADTQPPQAVQREYTDLEVIAYLAGLMEMHGVSLPMTWEILETLEPAMRIEKVYQQLVSKGVLPANTTPAQFAGIVRVFAANLRTGYQPEQWPAAPIKLLLSSQTSEAQLNSTKLGSEQTLWLKHLPKLEVAHSAVNHMQLLKKNHVHQLMELIHIKY